MLFSGGSNPLPDGGGGGMMSSIPGMIGQGMGMLQDIGVFGSPGVRSSRSGDWGAWDDTFGGGQGDASGKFNDVSTSIGNIAGMASNIFGDDDSGTKHPSPTSLGKSAKAYFDAAYPGTNSWERLGSSGAGAGGTQGPSAGGREARKTKREEMQNMQQLQRNELSTREEIAHIGAKATVDAAGTKPFSAIAVDNETVARLKEDTRNVKNTADMKEVGSRIGQWGGEAGDWLKDRFDEVYDAVMGGKLSLSEGKKKLNDGVDWFYNNFASEERKREDKRLRLELGEAPEKKGGKTSSESPGILLDKNDPDFWKKFQDQNRRN